jgi:hypothetical protein
MVDIPVTWNRRASACRTDPSSVLSALVQLTAALPVQVLLEFAALHAVIR